MTSGQKAIKYAAIGFAIFLIVNISIGIISVICSGLSIFSDEESNREYVEYSVSQDIKTLEIETNVAVIEIQSGDEFSLKSNCEEISVEENEGLLSIEEKSNDFLFKTKGKIILTIPRDYMFDKVCMAAGAGKVDVSELSAETIEMSLGAGEVDIVGLTASSDVKIDGGVGEVSIEKCELNNATVNMGVGEFNIEGMLTGKSEIDYGVGEANLKLKGTESDYTINMKKGLGESKIAGNSVKSDTVYGDGENYISIDGGVGEIDVEFY